MSCSIIDCGLCGHMFDCAPWVGGRVEMMNPIKCPKCGAERSGKYGQDTIEWKPAELIIKKTNK